MRCQSCTQERDELAFEVVLSSRGPKHDRLDTVCQDCRAAKPWLAVVDPGERRRVRDRANAQRKRTERSLASLSGP
jgi:hypothetical protein